MDTKLKSYFKITITRWNSMGGITRRVMTAPDELELATIIANIVAQPDTLIEFTVVHENVPMLT